MAVILAAVAWLLTYLLHSTVLLVGAFALAGLGLVRSHAGRDTLWKVALVGGIVTATAQLALQLQPAAGHVALASYPESPFVDVAGVRHVAPASPISSADIGSDSGARFATDISASEPLVNTDEPVRNTRPLLSGLHISWPAMILNVWFVGALGLGARLLWMRLSLTRGLRARRELSSGPLADSLHDLCASSGVAAPRLSVSAELPGPIAFGREICIPERVLSALTPAEQRAVLAHELGHVVRRDPAWLMIAALIENVFFIQPLNRFARRRLRAESEFLCDDWAAERTGGVVLARCLAEVAGWVQGHPAPAGVAGMAGSCSQLVSRVERLLDGSARARPAKWFVRATAAAAAIAMVASSVPGVAAEDLDQPGAQVVMDDEEFPEARFASLDLPGEGWGAVRDEGRLVILSAGYSVRLTGSGRIGFRQWGRALAIPDDYEVRIGGVVAAGDRDLCDSTRVISIVQINGEGAWQVEPVRRAGVPAYAEHRHDGKLDGQQRGELSRAGREIERATREVTRELQQAQREMRAEIRAAISEVSDAEVDVAIDGEADAAIDTLVQLWVRDPEAVRRAARRIARTYDRELRPQFESLGVEVGRELAPQLERLTTRLGRDLAPEFARLGAAIGASILSDLSAGSENGAGHGDYRSKTRPKNR